MVGFYLLCRGGEIVADGGSAGQGPLKCEDVQLWHVNEHGRRCSATVSGGRVNVATFHWRFSKNDQCGRGQERAAGATGAATCPVMAVASAKQRQAGKGKGGADTLFPKVSHNSLRSWIKQSARVALKPNASRFSNHGVRRGGACAFFFAGASEYELCYQGRWSMHARGTQGRYAVPTLQRIIRLTPHMAKEFTSLGY